MKPCTVCHWLTPIISGSCYKYNFCRDKHTFVATKHVFCRDKSMFAATKLLSRQNYVCRVRDKRRIFFATKISLSRLSRQNYVCRVPDKRRVFSSDKQMFVATKVSFVGTILVTNMFNATKVLSR